MMRQKSCRYKKHRIKKVRGWKNKHRATVKISNITKDGFTLCTFNRVYHIFFETFAFFKGATHKEIQDVILLPCQFADPVEDSGHGDDIRWRSLNIDIGTNSLEFPERYVSASHAKPRRETDSDRQIC